MRKFLTETPTTIQCDKMLRSSGLLISCQPAAATSGNRTMTVTTAVQNHENGSTNHPTNNNKVSASGVMLRLRLSNIFHRDNADNLFFIKCPLLSGIKGSIHAPICQSPLIHR